MTVKIEGQMRMTSEWVEMIFQDVSTESEAYEKFDSFEYDTTFSNFRLIDNQKIKRDWLEERK